MKLVSFRTGDQVRLGALLADNEHVLDLASAGNGMVPDARSAFRNMLAFIEAGAGAMACATQILAEPPADALLPLDAVRLLAPLPRPEQIRCFSAYEEHARRSAEVMMRVMAGNSPDPQQKFEELRASGKFEIPRVFFERPLYYKGNRFSVVGTDTDVDWPDYSNLIDFEFEIAAIIGQRGRDIAADEAAAHIFGYTICNDLSARDEQSREMVAPLGPAKGKDFDGGLVMGPCIVTADELPEPAGLHMHARINGETWTDTTSDGMAHSFADMLAYVSRSETVYPGEVFLSGCVGGGSGMENERYLSRGDVVELEVERIGTLRTRII